jgi:hypothetical protein
VDPPLAEVVTALLTCGLRLELISEHDFTLFPRWPFLERQPDDSYRMPAGTPSLPLMYSLRARRADEKPAGESHDGAGGPR